jgi:hypothetical protein
LIFYDHAEYPISDNFKKKIFSFCHHLKESNHSPLIHFFSTLIDQDLTNLKEVICNLGIEHSFSWNMNDLVVNNYSKSHFDHIPDIDENWKTLIEELMNVVLYVLEGLQQKGIKFPKMAAVEHSEHVKLMIEYNFETMSLNQSLVEESVGSLALLLRYDLLLDLLTLLLTGRIEESCSFLEVTFSHLRGEFNCVEDSRFEELISKLKIHRCEIEAGIVLPHPFAIDFMKLLESHFVQLQAMLSVHKRRIDRGTLNLIVLKSEEECKVLQKCLTTINAQVLTPNWAPDSPGNLPSYLISSISSFMGLGRSFPWEFVSLLIDASQTEGYLQAVFDTKFEEYSLVTFVKVLPILSNPNTKVPIDWITSIFERYAVHQISERNTTFIQEEINDMTHLDRQLISKNHPSLQSIVLFMNESFRVRYPLAFDVMVKIHRLQLIPRNFTHFCDFILNESVCVKVIKMDEIIQFSYGNGESFLFSLFRLHLSYDTCFLFILATNSGDERVYAKLFSYFHLFCELEFFIVIRLFFTEEELCNYFRTVVLSNLPKTKNILIQSPESSHEKFLAHIPCLDALKAQAEI